MTTRGSLGWLFLAAALAVPGFMFFKWWSRVNEDKKRANEERVVKRLPIGEMFSADKRPKNEFTNPIAAGPATGYSAVPEQNAAPVAVASPTASAVVLVAAEIAAPASPEGASPPSPEALPISPAAPAAPAPAAGLGDAPAVSSALSRDPTLSPYDLYRLDQMKFVAELRQEEVRDEADLIESKPIKREAPVENTVHLQGIISNPDGNKAIIDGEMVSEGDSVGAVKVLKITAQSVYFQHKKKRFMKSLSK